MPYTNDSRNYPIDQQSYGDDNWSRAVPTAPAPAAPMAPAAAPWQHPQAAYSPGTSMYAPRLTQAGDAWTLHEHGGQRQLTPEEAMQAQGYVTDFWNQFPTGFQQDGRPQVNEAYGNPGYQPPFGGGTLADLTKAPAGPMPDGNQTFDPGPYGGWLDLHRRLNPNAGGGGVAQPTGADEDSAYAPNSLGAISRMGRGSSYRV